MIFEYVYVVVVFIITAIKSINISNNLINQRKGVLFSIFQLVPIIYIMLTNIYV